MQSCNHTYAIFTSFFLIFIVLLISVMCDPVLGATETLRTIRVSADCSTVKVHSRGDPVSKDPKKFPEKYRSSIISPGNNQIQLLQIAFGQLPPFVCKAVNRAAFVEKEYEDENGNPQQDVLAFVSDRYPDLIVVMAPEIKLDPNKPLDPENREKNYYPTEYNLQLRDGLFREYKEDGEMVPAAESLRKNLIVWKKTIKTILHEANHSAIHLLESSKNKPRNNYCSSYYDWVRGTDFFKDNGWTAGAKNEAKSLIKKTGLEEGFLNEWCRLHNNFVEANMSEHYNPGLRSMKVTNPGPLGFLSEYSQKSPSEDIAEMAALIQLNNYETRGDLTVGDLHYLNIEDAQKQRYSDVKLYFDYYNYCQRRFQTTQSKGVPPNLAAAYTKMNLLLDLGLITEDAFQACIGTGKVGLENGGKETKGFHVLDFETGAFKHSYELTNIGHAPVSSESDDRSFILVGKGTIEDGGKQRNLDFWLRFNTTRTNESEKIYNLPRGIYKLDWDWQLFPGQAKVSPCPPLFSETDAPFTFYVNSEDAPSRSFCTVNGQILVTRSSKDFFEATLYVHKVLKRVGGSAVQLPSPFAVAGIPVPFLAGGVLVPEVPNFRVYIRWER